MNTAKKVVWKIFLPFHDIVRDTLLSLKLLRHEGRQDYYLGHLHPERELENLIVHLKARGFDDRHFASWTDSGEVIDLRLLESFHYQYHIRLFEDREIRGHYEVTPESRPIAHLLDWYTEPRYETFLQLLDGWVVQERSMARLSGNTKSQSAPAASRESPTIG